MGKGRAAAKRSLKSEKQCISREDKNSESSVAKLVGYNAIAFVSTSIEDKSIFEAPKRSESITKTPVAGPT